MESNQTDRLTALLNEAQRAHGTYEATELNGVFDQEWPQWYAAYAVEHGLGEILGHDVTADAAGAFLTRAYAEYEQTDPKPEASWAEVLAPRMLNEL
ncbi:MAG: hypothetical protein ACR2K4_03380 [Candidatus Limnocylindria bacterium]